MDLGKVQGEKLARGSQTQRTVKEEIGEGLWKEEILNSQPKGLMDDFMD